MTNATKTLALLFVATVALALATTWGSGSPSSAAFQGSVLEVDSAQVQAVRIERPDAPTIRLEKSSGSWSVAPGDTSVSYPASRSSVERLLGSLPSLEVSAIATRQTDKHPRYGVDSTGTRVTMLGAGNEPLGSLIVGRTEMRRSSSAQRQARFRRGRGRGVPITYVRSPEAPDVYSIEQPLNALVGRSVEEWRDKTIWNLARSQIERISFQYPADSSFTIERAADTTGGTSTNWVSAGDTLSTTAVSSLLRTVSSPEANAFAEGVSPESLSDAPYTVRLHLSDGSRRALRIRPAGNGSDYLLTADNYPYVARIRASRWDRVVLQGRDAFLQDD